MTLRREVVLKVYLASLWLVCLYRAFTQSIVHDEALTYQLYLAAPAARMFDVFSANHHFLNTILMRMSVGLLGVSAWSMRLPALAGAALYFSAVYRISVKEFRGSTASLVTAALLTLNPIVLDFMVAARGYGMGLALVTWAFAVLLSYLRDPEAQSPLELATAGGALALSVAANLIFAIPAAVMTVLVPVLLRKDPRAVSEPAAPAAGRKKKAKKMAKKKAAEFEDRKRGVSFWRYFVLPAAGVAILFFVSAPLHDARSADFYAGASKIMDSVHSLLEVSLTYGGPWRETLVKLHWIDPIGICLVALVLLGGIAVGVRSRNLLLLLASGTAVGSALLLVLGHLAFDVPYPVDRTGIYFFAFVPVTLVGLAEAGNNSGGPANFGAKMAYAIAVLLVAQFALQFNTRKFFVWEYDADTLHIVDWLSQRNGNKQPDSVRVTGSWQLEPSLNFYREKNHLAWMRPITREPPQTGEDYYVLLAQDRALVGSLGLKIVYEGTISGTTLATP
jgi:hypothetical protein